MFDPNSAPTNESATEKIQAAKELSDDRLEAIVAEQRAAREAAQAAVKPAEDAAIGEALAKAKATASKWKDVADMSDPRTGQARI
ncbi:MAG: hypothetical protein Q7S52_01205 [bacterium]|nr:hypothetical protein [bacterium]